NLIEFEAQDRRRTAEPLHGERCAKANAPKQARLGRTLGSRKRRHRRREPAKAAAVVGDIDLDPPDTRFAVHVDAGPPFGRARPSYWDMKDTVDVRQIGRLDADGIATCGGRDRTPW